uniref:Uncharacterized protein n=1 Tax=Cannabis sativa TaxID=3483 RepID=A0A803PT44_CANSA
MMASRDPIYEADAMRTEANAHQKFVIDLLDAEDKENLMPKILALEEVDKAKEAAQKIEAVNSGTTIPVGENMDDSSLKAYGVPVSTNCAIPEVLPDVPHKDTQLLKDPAQS